MRGTALLTLLWLCYCCCSSFTASRVGAQVATLADVPEQSGVLLLSHSTLALAVETYASLFLLLDAPTRRGSLELFRAFAEAAVALRASHTRLRFGALDVLEPSDVLDRLNVVGLPALVRLQCPPKMTTLTTDTDLATTNSSIGCALDDAAVENYAGGRTSAEFQRFMLAQPQRDVVIVRDADALQALVRQQPVVVLVVVDGRDTQPYFDAIALAQADASTSVYAVSANLALLSEARDAGDSTGTVPALALFRDFGATRVAYTGPWRKRAVQRFVQLNKYSAVSTYASAFSSVLFDPKAAAHVLLFADASASYCDALLAQTQALALPYTSALLSSAPLRFVHVGVEETALRHALFVADRHVPTVLVVETVGDPPVRFPLVGEQLIAALETTEFSSVLGEWLDAKYPLVYQTSEVTDDDEDEDDGGDEDDTSGFAPFAFAFEAAAIPMSPDDAGHPGDDSTMLYRTTSDQWRDALAVQRRLRQVAIESDATATATPWNHRAPSRVHHVTDVRWLVDQQASGDHDVVVVSFASPRCFACRAFTHVLEQAATAAHNCSTVFAAVDVDTVDVTPLGLAFSRLPSVFAFPRRRVDAALVRLESQTLRLADVLAFVDATCRHRTIDRA